MNNIDKNKFNSEDWLEFDAFLDKIDSFRKMILCEEDEDEDFFPHASHL